MEQEISDENCENEGKQDSSSSKHKLKENISGEFYIPQLLIFFSIIFFLGLAKVEKLQTEQIDFETLLSKSKDLMKEMKLQDFNEIPKTVIKDSTVLAKVSIKPYTESQLSALYHNSELDTLDAFITQYVDAELKGKMFRLIMLTTRFFMYIQVYILN